MTDHFEQAKDDILARTEGNGGPSSRDLLGAMQGLARDMDAQHREQMDATVAIGDFARENRRRLDEGCAESVAYYERVEAIDRWRQKSAADSERHVLAAIAAHEKSCRLASGASVAAKHAWLWAIITSKTGAVMTAVVIAALITVVNIALKLVWFGNP